MALVSTRVHTPPSEEEEGDQGRWEGFFMMSSCDMEGDFILLCIARELVSDEDTNMSIGHLVIRCHAEFQDGYLEEGQTNQDIARVLDDFVLISHFVPIPSSEALRVVDKALRRCRRLRKVPSEQILEAVHLIRKVCKCSRPESRSSFEDFKDEISLSVSNGGAVSETDSESDITLPLAPTPQLEREIREAGGVSVGMIQRVFNNRSYYNTWFFDVNDFRRCRIRPPPLISPAGPGKPDSDWVKHAIKQLKNNSQYPDRLRSLARQQRIWHSWRGEFECARIFLSAEEFQDFSTNPLTMALLERSINLCQKGRKQQNRLYNQQLNDNHEQMQKYVSAFLEGCLEFIDEHQKPHPDLLVNASVKLWDMFRRFWRDFDRTGPDLYAEIMSLVTNLFDLTELQSIRVRGMMDGIVNVVVETGRKELDPNKNPAHNQQPEFDSNAVRPPSALELLQELQEMDVDSDGHPKRPLSVAETPADMAPIAETSHEDSQLNKTTMDDGVEGAVMAHLSNEDDSAHDEPISLFDLEKQLEEAQQGAQPMWEESGGSDGGAMKEGMEKLANSPQSPSKLGDTTTSSRLIIECANCGGFASRCCGGCTKVAYCSEGCQREHWKLHKLLCDEYIAHQRRQARKMRKKSKESSKLRS